MMLTRMTHGGPVGIEGMARELPAGLADDTHPEAASLARWFVRAMDVAFAAGHRYAGLQQQGNVSPYLPGDIQSVIRESPGGAEVLSFLAWVTSSRGRERASDSPHEE